MGNPAGLIALLGLIPLIILYLIRPRPKQMPIPSLMFFMKSSGAKKLTSFLQQITQDWLFIIQLIILLALLLTFANPFTKYQHDVTASQTVIVLDASASSQTQEGALTRFDLATRQAKQVLGSKNTIILVKDVPFIALQDASAQEAATFLNSVQPVSSGSRIGEAIILAGEALGSEGRVVVLSDFINTGGQDPEVAKSVLEAKGIVVDFITIGEGKKSNVGIIELEAGNVQSTVYVKNFNNKQERVPLKIGASQTTLTLPALGVETFSFQTPAGMTKIEIDVNDDLAVDNVAYLSAPEGGRAKVMLVANNASPFLKNALSASGEMEVVQSAPPVIDNDEFDVIVVHNVDKNEVLRGTFRDLLKRAENGATVIVAVQENSDQIDYEGLLPVTLKERTDGGLVEVVQQTSFTKNVEFGAARGMFAADPIGSQIVVAQVQESPVITIKKVGQGKVIYFGLLENGEFPFSPNYPIFWTELLKYVTDRDDVRNLNFKTGETLLLDEEQRVRTPSKTVQRAALVLDEAGVYELENRNIAVNLVNEFESNINPGTAIGTKSTDYELRPVKETREFPWTLLLLVIALGVAVFEIFFVKYRGDV